MFKACSACVGLVGFFLIEILLIYNVVLISAVQQSDSVTHTYTFFVMFFPL